jgi:hypothetical protein
MNRPASLAVSLGTALAVVAGSVSLAAQWPKFRDNTVPRDAQGRVNYDAPAPRTADGKIDFTGVWQRANSAPPGRGRGRGAAAGAGGGAAAGARAGAPAPGAPPQGAPGAPGARGGIAGGQPTDGVGAGGGRGGVSLEPTTAPFPFDPTGPPLATFFEAGGNIEGGLPYTPWALGIRKQRFDVDKAKDNPDANCFPMGFLQFHQQPQPRKIIQTKQLILIEYEANYGLRHIYLDGRPLPKQGDPQPWWYGYSVGHWEGDTLVVETNNLRGAEDSPYDGWLDVNGSPYSQQAKFIERFKRVNYGHLIIDTTLEDAKAYTKPWTVRVDQRIMVDEEPIEFVCNENQQFRRRIKID